jgi:hypothetical protein
MATEAERDALRADIDAPTLKDEDADAILADAATQYSDPAAAHAGARVIALRRLLAGAAKLTDYRVNASTESRGQVFRHLRDLLTTWQGELDAALAAGKQAGQQARRTSYAVPNRVVW